MSESEPLADPFPVRFPSRTARHISVASIRLRMSKTAIVRVAVEEWLARNDADFTDGTQTEQETN